MYISCICLIFLIIVYLYDIDLIRIPKPSYTLKLSVKYFNISPQRAKLKDVIKHNRLLSVIRMHIIKSSNL